MNSDVEISRKIFLFLQIDSDWWWVSIYKNSHLKKKTKTSNWKWEILNCSVESLWVFQSEEGFDRQTDRERDTQSAGHVIIKRYSFVQHQYGIEGRSLYSFFFFFPCCHGNQPSSQPAAATIQRNSLLHHPAIFYTHDPPSSPHIRIAYQHMDYYKPTSECFYSKKKKTYYKWN